MQYPVVFIHRGAQNYLHWALRQANEKNENVYLIGDDSNELFKNIATFISIKSLSDRLYSQFAESYVHMSSNSKKFEMMCFERWFLLLELMKKNNLEYVIHLDSDVLLYVNMHPVIEEVLDNKIAGFHIPEQSYDEMRWIAVPHCSIWSIKGLESFCMFIIDQYIDRIDELNNKWKWHTDKKQRGGISDMALLYLFYRSNPSQIENLAITSDEKKCFDTNINTSDNYHHDEYRAKKSFFLKQLKVIKFSDKVPTGYNKCINETIEFSCLHCQGVAKILMYLYSTPDKSVRDFINYINFLIPFLTNRLITTFKYKFSSFFNAF